MYNIRNEDIIKFRYELINQFCAKTYYINGVACNDGKTNVMTAERKETLEDVLSMFNVFFRTRGYDIG